MLPSFTEATFSRHIDPRTQFEIELTAHYFQYFVSTMTYCKPVEVDFQSTIKMIKTKNDLVHFKRKKTQQRIKKGRKRFRRLRWSRHTHTRSPHFSSHAPLRTCIWNQSNKLLVIIAFGHSYCESSLNSVQIESHTQWLRLHELFDNVIGRENYHSKCFHEYLKPNYWVGTNSAAQLRSFALSFLA